MTPSRFLNRLLAVGTTASDSPDLRQRKRILVSGLWGGLVLNMLNVLLAVGTPGLAMLPSGVGVGVLMGGSIPSFFSSGKGKQSHRNAKSSRHWGCS